MNALFPETRSHRNAPWSDHRDNPAPSTEPTERQLARETIAENARLLLADAEHWREHFSADEMTAIRDLAGRNW